MKAMLGWFNSQLLSELIKKKKTKKLFNIAFLTIMLWPPTTFLEPESWHFLLYVDDAPSWRLIVFNFRNIMTNLHLMLLHWCCCFWQYSLIVHHLQISFLKLPLNRSSMAVFLFGLGFVVWCGMEKQLQQNVSLLKWHFCLSDGFWRGFWLYFDLSYILLTWLLWHYHSCKHRPLQICTKN